MSTTTIPITDEAQSRILTICAQVVCILRDTALAWSTRCSARSLMRRARLGAYIERLEALQQPTSLARDVGIWSLDACVVLNESFPRQSTDVTSMIKNPTRRARLTGLIEQMNSLCVHLLRRRGHAANASESSVSA